MKIGIISDTHDQIDNIKKAVKKFKREKVVLVYHLGDFCSPFTLKLYENLQCSVKAVFGNNDGDIFKLLAWKPHNMEFFDRFYVDEFEGKKIAITHGDPYERVLTLFERDKYDLLLYGHTHIAEIKKNDRTLLINPGCLIEKFKENQYTKKWTEPSIAIYDLGKNSAKIINL